MIYYRDPLLDKICARIGDLPVPAYIKNSELVFVAVNQPFVDLFGGQISDYVGTSRADHADVNVLFDVAEKERACVVFGEDQRIFYSDPFGKGRFGLELERFTLADGQTFVYCVFSQPVAQSGRAASPAVAPKAESEQLSVPQKRDHLTKASLPSTDIVTSVLGPLDIGVSVWDAEERLTYLDASTERFYASLGCIAKPGMDALTIMSAVYDHTFAGSEASQTAPTLTREAWIARQLGRWRADNVPHLLELPDGRYFHAVTRALPDGSRVALRTEATHARRSGFAAGTASEEISLYRELLDRQPVATYARDQDHRLIYANPAYAALFGVPLEQLVGTVEADIMGEHAASVHALNHETLVNGTAFENEQPLPLDDGKDVTIFSKSSRLVTRAGSRYLVGNLLDLTHLKMREKMVEEANAHAAAIWADFEEIVSALNVGLILLDEDLNIRLVNSAYKDKIWGKPSETWKGGLVGRSFVEHLRHNYGSDHKFDGFATIDDYCEMRAAEIRSGKTQVREIALPDGTAKLYHGIKLASGNYLVSYVDVTELRSRDREIVAAHLEVDRAYNLVTSATNAMPEGLMVVENNRIVLANKALSGVINVPEEMLQTGGSWPDVFYRTTRQNPFLAESDIDASFARFQEALGARKTVSYVFQLDMARWIRVELRPSEGAQMVIMCTDHTDVMLREAELKKLIAKAEAADRAKSEFLANMSLEIRTPMNGILGMAELLSQSALDTRQKAFIDIIVKSANALMTIINDILDFSRLDAGQLQLKTAPFDPAVAVEDVGSLFASHAQEKRLELVTRIEPGLPATVIGDAGRFRQVISKLLSNAVKFTERGQVVVSISAKGEEEGHVVLEVVVEDTGIGISPSRLSEIFEEFARMEEDAGHRDGTGLGLAISQRLASLQGGFISADSREGEGSRFTLTLPLPVAVARCRPSESVQKLAGARLLVVDDHPAARQHLEDLCLSWGLDAVSAPDTETALAIHQAAAEAGVCVEALVIDHDLGGETGAGLIRRIRASAGANVPIVLLIPQDGAFSDAHLKDLDVQAQLTKPVRGNQLRDVLADLIRDHRRKKGARPGAAARSDHAASEETGSEVVQSHLHSDRAIDVLVAEDNEINRIVFSQILEASDRSFLLVENGRQAVESWSLRKPRAIVMDLTLPELDGLAAARAIRSRETGTATPVPIIGVITHDDADDRSRCIEAGMNAVIVKPISPERLQDLLARLLDQPVSADLSA